MTFYILIKFTVIGFLILTMLLMLGALFFGDKSDIIYILPMITLVCFMVSAIVFFPIQADYQKKAVVDSLHLKNEDAIESIHPIGRHNESFYEVKISDGFYHVTFESGALVPTVSKVEKVNEKK
ncbi:hypothetical protein P7D15_02410 [Bacillus cereus]|uniref:hypothetical protein n=1 Tax=Bacillus cereus TaxID=1396 RepID=UPI00240628E8|nr:hypothetical protein [Bacillus cereus]MDF9599272.1 hypothetical protein [Bacillus cereus]MDG1589604.1 hypothetical protein [Bacillus cereus]